MAVEVLLPSEIARLIYGYLVEEKCTETAKTFLNESPNLYECRSLQQCGRPFPTRHCGLTLINILDKFCTINTIVQDQLIVYDPTNKVKYWLDIITQLKFLLEAIKSQTASSSNEPIQNEHATASGTPSKSKKRHSNRNNNGLHVAMQSDDGYQTETPPDSNSLQNIPSVEATPLEHLPGYIESLQCKKLVKSPAKVTNKFTQGQPSKENGKSQVIQTTDAYKICQASQHEQKKVQSQQVQTSFKITEPTGLLALMPITSSVQKVPNESHKSSEEKLKRLNSDSTVYSVEDPLSKSSDFAIVKSKSDLCNNLGNDEKNQEVINLDDSGDQTSLESQAPVDKGTKIVEMEIDNENPSSEENISNKENNQLSVSPVLQNVQSAKIPEVIASGNVVIPNSEVLSSQISPVNASNNPVESSLFDKNFPNPTDFPNSNTSTPLKLFAATQNFDTNEWFTTQALPSPSIIPIKETVVVGGDFPYAQTATENIVGTIDGFISPIICKENTKVAEKILLNCSATAKKDETLHTPDVPPVTKSFIPTLPALSVPFKPIPPKDKTSILQKNSEEVNAPPNVQTPQDTSPGFISISSLVKNTEFNRYFSIDSISVAQMDNTSNTVRNPSIVPESDNSDGLSGTGLSPFLKFNKKPEESRESANSEITNEKIEDTQTFLKGKIDETSSKANEIAVKGTSDEEFKNFVEKGNSESATSQMHAPSVTNGVEKSLEAVTTDDIVNDVEMTGDVSSNMDICETVEGISVNREENVDLTLKAVTNEAGDKSNSEFMEVVEETVETVPAETNDCRKEKGEEVISKDHDKATENTKHDVPKVQATSGKKESLKAFLSKTFESYIDRSKEKTASNHNNEMTTKNTPKAKLEERPKNQRRSLSTPKKPSSHIRALTFETPIQSRSDSKINDMPRCPSPETAKKNLKKLHESFQSPPVVDCGFSNQAQYNEENGEENCNAENATELAGNQLQEKKERNTKKNWDADLRMLVGPPSEMPKVVEIPRRRKARSKEEESSAKKKKRNKSKTPKKKSDKSPHKKSKKTPRKYRKHDKSKEHGDASKTEEELSERDCEDLGALIENNLLSSKDDKKVSKKKVEDKLSAKECKDISAQIEQNLMPSKKNNVIKTVEIKSKVDEKSSTKEFQDKSAQNENKVVPIKNKSHMINIKSSNENKNTKNEDKKAHNKGESNKLLKKGNAEMVKNEKQMSEVSSKKEKTNNTERVIPEVPIQTETKVQEITTQPSLPSNFKTSAKKDPIEYLLSDSINEEDVFNMEMDSSDILYHEQLKNASKPIDREIAEKMQQDEQAIAAVLEAANVVINEKFKAMEEKAKRQDFFPETSLMTDADESEEEEGEVRDDDVVMTEVDDNKGSIGKKESKVWQESQMLTQSEQKSETANSSSKSQKVDYESIEKQLSIITDTELVPTRKVIYDQVSKVEDGKIVKKKYARLKTLDTKFALESTMMPIGGCEMVLESSQSTTEGNSMELPPTPQIIESGSNSWVPNPFLINHDSRTIACSVPTPLECPPTPRIVITPQKVDEAAIDAVTQKDGTVPFYHLTEITFDTAQKSKVTEFEVVKETLLKKTTPKTPNEKKGVESKAKKTPGSASKSSSRMDSEDSDSSSSSDSSDSSSSSSSDDDDDDDDDDCSMQPTAVEKAKEVPLVVRSKPETKLELLIQNEEVVIGNEVIFIEHEEIVVAHELSPAKVFPIHKTDKELEETVKETPAKDENMIPEEGIFETPNVSKPVDNPTNLHAKISQMMILKEQEELRRLESQQKPKIINVEYLPAKNVTQQPKAPPAKVETTTAETKEAKKKIVEKSESEVAQAIESIVCEKFDKSQNDLNLSADTTTVPKVPKEKVKKRELSKAIQSITNDDEGGEGSDSSSSDESSSEDDPNLEPVLEDEGKEEDFSLGFDNDNCDTQHTEYHFIFDEANCKKRRRRQFSDDEMRFEPQDEDGNILGKVGPSPVDILLNIIPPKILPTKKKAELKRKLKGETIKEVEFDDGDSSEDFQPDHRTRPGTKRRRSGDEPKSRKRKKNIFIY